MRHGNRWPNPRSGTGPASTANKAAACASLLTTRSSLLKDPAALGAARSTSCSRSGRRCKDLFLCSGRSYRFHSHPKAQLTLCLPCPSLFPFASSPRRRRRVGEAVYRLDGRGLARAFFQRRANSPATVHARPGWSYPVQDRRAAPSRGWPLWEARDR